MITESQPRRGEVLVAIMNNERDFRLLREDLWYRIPVATAPKRWPPRWLAFYQTKVFGDERWSVNYYCHLRSTGVVRRRELFPQESPRQRRSSGEVFNAEAQRAQRFGGFVMFCVSRVSLR